MILIAHDDGCDLRPNKGIVQDFHTGQRSEFWEPCSCGGRKVELIVGEAHSAGAYKAVIRFPEQEVESGIHA